MFNKNENQSQHEKQILKQFSYQAIPFAELPSHMSGIDILLEMSKVKITDKVLDVACGPGLVSCEFAFNSAYVTGIDITPEMIIQAKKRQQANNLKNLEWIQSDAFPLPFEDNSFDVIVSRYSFHHMLNYDKIFDEMFRVCKTGGRIVIADVSLEEKYSQAYDQMEILRDSSHVHALTHEEFNTLFINGNLINCQQISYDVELELEAQLNASLLATENQEKLRQLIKDDINKNTLGINAHLKDNNVYYYVPIKVLVGEKVIK
ncbi:methyltransferase domain-containing protein [Lentisphaerota bacterium WC36G]|nr:methyltransferase domain-containing protein [Lentisphaerae bacterium WC36]